MLEIPNTIDDADIVSYLILNKKHIKTDKTRHWIYGQLAEEIFGLAIGQYKKDAGFYLFYCDKNWTTITDTYHEAIEGAKDQAEFEYENTIDDWVEKR